MDEKRLQTIERMPERDDVEPLVAEVRRLRAAIRCALTEEPAVAWSLLTDALAGAEQVSPEGALLLALAARSGGEIVITTDDRARVPEGAVLEIHQADDGVTRVRVGSAT